MKMKHVKTFSNIFNNWETYIYQDNDGNYFFDDLGHTPLLSHYDTRYNAEKTYYMSYVPLDFILEVVDLDTILKHPLYGLLYLAQFGTDEDRKKLRKHKFWRVRAAVAEFGTDEDRKFLSKDSDDYVRLAVIAFGNKHIKNKMRLRGLLTDRINLAKFGDDDDRDALINDNCVYVLEQVAKYGNYQQCNILLKKYKDKNSSLCKYIVRYMKDKEKFNQDNNKQQKLFNDEEIEVLIPISVYERFKPIHELLTHKNVYVHPQIVKVICANMKKDVTDNTIYLSEIEEDINDIIKILSLDENEEVKGKTSKYDNDKHRKYSINNKMMPIVQTIVEYGNDKQREYIINNHELTDSLSCQIAIYGNNEQKQYILEKELASKNPHISTLLNLAIFGTDEHREQLINHPNEFVRKQIAKHGNHKHKQLLINDPNYHVIAELIKSGNHYQKQYLFKKVKNGNIQLKEVVVEAFIQYSNDKQRKYFINHPSERMRELLARHGNNKIHKKLINDESENVRECVAVYCTDKLRNVLMKDKSEKVRQTVKEYHSKSFK